MPFGLSDWLARQGMIAPTTPAVAAAPVSGPSPAAMAMPRGAVPVDPATVAPPPAAAGAAGGMDPAKMMALMQAFGGLKMPAPVMTEQMRPPTPVAPQGANSGTIVNTGNTAAMASLLASGLGAPPVSALGQLVMPGRR